MTKSKFTEEPILFTLKQGKDGQASSDVCRQIEMSQATARRTQVSSVGDRAASTLDKAPLERTLTA